MAGITLIYQQGQIATALIKSTEAAIEKLPEVSVLLKEKELIILKKGHEKYPVYRIEQPDYMLLVEGKIYRPDILKDEVFKTHIHGLLHPQKKEASLSYLRKLDGEFIIYLFDKIKAKVVVVNDFLGRLPVYYSHSGYFILSRDINLVHILTEKIEFSEQGIYEYMRLGYPLGKRTLFKNLYRLPPSSTMELNGGIHIQSQTISLKEWQEAGREVKKQEEALYEIFQQAVQHRLEMSTNPVLSLSGGLDSRIIMGEIEKQKKNVAYESFLYKNAIIESDVAVVKKLCSLYDTQFGLTELQEWSPGYFDELINAKYGMNYLGMAFIIPFLKSMAQQYDVMLTGDGGDKTLAYLFPEKHLFQKDLASQILQRNEVTSARVCSQIFNFDMAINEQEMRAHLNGYGYPSQDLNYKHFLIFERTKNWLFEGEDRNRQYIWSTSPYYHPGFFQMVHSIDERKKKNFKLYRLFTQLVHPELNKITNANWGFPIHQTGQLTNLLFRQQIKQHIKPILPKGKRNIHDTEEMPGRIKDELLGNRHDAFFNQKLIVNELSRESLFHLLTLLKTGNKIS
ncbi:MAG: hypothetical protein KQH67_06290 [Bacteroidetes bacterium]|nr:hypothetical protein [Bacteroidota bacterium]